MEDGAGTPRRLLTPTSGKDGHGERAEPEVLLRIPGMGVFATKERRQRAC